MNPQRHSVGAIDIGTNSVRLLILADDGATLEREMVITRLGQGVDQTGALHRDAIARTTAVLRSYRALLDKHQVQRVRATATSAARDASNRDVFFSEAEATLGTRPELISGAEEAGLSFRGATTGLAPELGPFLVLDIGGGSTEFVLGQSEPEALISVALGCVRMTERHIVNDPPTAAELAACAQATRDALVDVVRTVPVQRARLLVGLAGTITSLASLAQGSMRYDPAITHHSRLKRSVVAELCDRLASVSVAERRKLLAEPKRAEVLVAGAVVLLTIMQELAVDELMVSESDILDGLAASIRSQ
jgi:exopolyphosphatase/guanosine-5'-triphosphate,3'-diphosphate pyrophosphatase